MSNKYLPLVGLAALSLAGLTNAQIQHGDPYEPVGELTVTPTVVQVGKHPQMFWGIDYPEIIDDLVDIGAGGYVTTNKPLRVQVRMVGVAFQSGDTSLPAALWIRINGGTWQLLFYGHHYDVRPEQFVYNKEHPAGTRIDLCARGKNTSGQWYSSRWTATPMSEVATLKNGDTPPSYAPAYNQGRVEDFLTKYLSSSNKVVLGPRDLIFLAELASTNPGDWYYDMQDLSALLTFAETDDPEAGGGSLNGGEYVNFIRQTQRDNPGVERDVWVAEEGNQLSEEGVSEAGSFFQLWSIHNQSELDFLLDEQLVTSYTPAATITIETGDPYGPVRRTRVDQPFTVTYRVSGLQLPGEDIPLAATQVATSHKVFNYPAGQHSLGGVANPEGTLLEQRFLNENGDASFPYALTNLQAADLTLAEGEEVFTVSALEDYNATSTVLDSERLQIWPIATGSLSGFDPNVRYEVVPAVSISLQNLYPSSATWVRLYPGSPSSQPEGAKMVTGSYYPVANSVPENKNWVLNKIDDYFTVDGLHTIEILHETPFGTDLLYSSSIQVDRTVEVTGSIFTQE